MRISDWSSDVCSSDLHTAVERLARDSGFFDQPENPRFLDTARLDIGPHRGPAQAGEGVGHQPVALAAGFPVGCDEAVLGLSEHRAARLLAPVPLPAQLPNTLRQIVLDAYGNAAVSEKE